MEQYSLTLRNVTIYWNYIHIKVLGNVYVKQMQSTIIIMQIPMCAYDVERYISIENEVLCKRYKT